MSPAAVHERERKREVPSNASNEQPSRNAPSLPPAERGPADRDRRERDDQHTVAIRPTEMPPEHMPDNGRFDRDAHYAVQPRGESQ